MIKLRLLAERAPGLYRQLEQLEVPVIESTDELNVLAVSVGELLSKYTDTIQDPNVVSALTDPMITDWTINDFESLQVVLNQNKLVLVISKEDQIAEVKKEGDVMYLMVDNTDKYLGVFPTSSYVLAPKDNTEVVEIIERLITRDYFNGNKFMHNILKVTMDNCRESKKLLGNYNPYALNQLFSILSTLNKQLLVITFE